MIDHKPNLFIWLKDLVERGTPLDSYYSLWVKVKGMAYFVCIQTTKVGS